MQVKDLAKGIHQKDRLSLAKAITLVESDHPKDQAASFELLSLLKPPENPALRLGFCGAPGVGKSSLINVLGAQFLIADKPPAVLCIDPSSPLSKGSILGDEIRMTHLTKDERAFIRPTASLGLLGGVHPRTRDVMLLCESFGFEVIFIETVGVGQMDETVRYLVDFMYLILQPHTGDDIQSIKRGNLELADAIIINKCDDQNISQAKRLKDFYQYTQKPVYLLSAISHLGIKEFVEDIFNHPTFFHKRPLYQEHWMRYVAETFLLKAFRQQAVKVPKSEYAYTKIAHALTYP